MMSYFVRALEFLHLRANGPEVSIHGNPFVFKIFLVVLLAALPQLGCVGLTSAKAPASSTDPAQVIPSITTQPASQTVFVGQTATFSVKCTGTAPLVYTWRKNGMPISDASSATYTTPATGTSDAGSQFSVVIKNSTGSVTSNAATLTVTPAPVTPSITTQPPSQTVTAGQTATFSVTTSGSDPLSFQWCRNGTAINGATSASYTTPATANSDSGSQFSVVVSNSTGSVTSNTATLTVSAAMAPAITVQPASQTVTAGLRATFSVTVSGTSPLSYQWRKNGTAISGAASAAYTTPAITTPDAGSQFSVVVTNAVGSVTSNPAILTINATLGTANEITREATAPNSETNHPLPLMASWQAGTQWNYNTVSPGFTPDWQMQMIDAGHHLLPWFVSPLPEMLCQTQTCQNNGSLIWPSYYHNGIQRAATNNLPISFVGTQWEHYLYDDPTYLNLPPNQNPNVVGVDGVVHTTVNPWGITEGKLSPFGPIGPWYDVGKKWGSSLLMQQLQGWYSNPPLAIFVSNNEAPKLSWTEVETDSRYVTLYGLGRSDDFKRQVVAEGWIARYRQLQQGFKDGLINSIWKTNAIFVGYEAFGPSYFGRWSGWKGYSLYIPNQIDPSPLMWDGGSASFYLESGPPTDNHVFSPQVEVMNYPFMMNEALQLNPTFWFEISTWNGCDWYPPNPSDPWCQRLLANIPNYTPARYAGMVQFGMWIIRPRVVRDYRDSVEPSNQSEPYFTALENAVDQIYVNPILQRFWRQGQLVANPARPHPYQADIPAEYATEGRMFMLSTSVDPPTMSALDTTIPVYVLARVIGQSPQRTWLVYAEAPSAPINGLTVTIPGYQNIQINANSAGEFYLVDETNGTVSLVDTSTGI
jgi:hypothetical protein